MTAMAEVLRPVDVGTMTDIDGAPIEFSINLDGTVRIAIGPFTSPGDRQMADLDKTGRDEFMRLWCEAERQAEAAGDG